jgi:hypothetical protein
MAQLAACGNVRIEPVCNVYEMVVSAILCNRRTTRHYFSTGRLLRMMFSIKIAHSSRVIVIFVS